MFSGTPANYNTLLLTAGEMPLFGGHGTSKSRALQPEVTNGRSCRFTPPFPRSISKAMGGLLLSTEGDSLNGLIVVCGGTATSPNGFNQKDQQHKECFVLSSKPWIQITQEMKEARSNAASIVIKEDKILWITGGTGEGDSSKALRSTELVSLLDESNLENDMAGSFSIKLGPELPVASTGHCMVKLNSTTALMIGGDDGTTKLGSTYYIDIEPVPRVASGTPIERNQGPDLRTPRSNHFCGLLSNPGDGHDKVVIVVGGKGGTNGSTELKSTEMLVVGSNSDEWIDGPNLSEDVNALTGLTSSDGKGFLLLAQDGDVVVNEKLEYDYYNGWKWEHSKRGKKDRRFRFSRKRVKRYSMRKSSLSEMT